MGLGLFFISFFFVFVLFIYLFIFRLFFCSVVLVVYIRGENPNEFFFNSFLPISIRIFGFRLFRNFLDRNRNCINIFWSFIFSI